jgi:hypothetical protein
MTKAKEKYFAKLYKLGKAQAPSGEEDFVKQANYLLENQFLPEGLAALVYGLTSELAVRATNNWVSHSKNEDALEALKSGRTNDAAKVMTSSIRFSSKDAYIQKMQPKFKKEYVR